MKQPVPLPDTRPFLTLVTMTRLRPEALARNMASVGRQTAVADIEQIVLPDHVGYGIVGGLYGRVPWYAHACRGEYVAWLNDDDALASETVVAELKQFVKWYGGSPTVITVNVTKGDVVFPKGNDWQDNPTEGDVDLGSYILRNDVWRAHAADYGKRYQGDYDHAVALRKAGHRPVHFGKMFAIGGAGNGRPELSL